LKDGESQFETRLTEITKQQQEKNLQINSLSETVKSKDTLLQTKENQIKLLEEKNNELIKQNNNLEEKLNDSNNQIKILKENKKSLEQDLTTKNLQNKVLTEKEIELNETKRLLQDNINVLLQQIKEKDEKFKNLEIQNNKQIEEKNILNTNQQIEIIKLKENYKNLEEEKNLLLSKQEQIIKLEKEKLEKEINDNFEKKLHERLKDLVETEAKFRKKLAEVNQQNQGSNKMITELTAKIQELQGDRDDALATKVEFYKMLQTQSAELEELRNLKGLSESKKMVLQMDAAAKEKEKLEREIKLLTREKSKLEEWKKRKKKSIISRKGNYPITRNK